MLRRTRRHRHMNDCVANSQKGMESNTEDTPEPEFSVPPLFNVTPLAFEPLMLTQLVIVTGSSFLIDSCHTGCCPAVADANLFASSAVGKTGPRAIWGGEKLWAGGWRVPSKGGEAGHPSMWRGGSIPEPCPLRNAGSFDPDHSERTARFER